MPCGQTNSSKKYKQDSCGNWNSRPQVVLNPEFTGNDLIGMTPEVLWDDPCANDSNAGTHSRRILWQFNVNGLIVFEIAYDVLATSIGIGASSTHAGLVFDSTDEVTAFLVANGVTINNGDTVGTRVFARNCLDVLADPSNIIEYVEGNASPPLAAKINGIDYTTNTVDGTNSVGTEFRVQVRRNGVVVYTSPSVTDPTSIPYSFTLQNNDLVCVQSTNDAFANWVEDCAFIPTPGMNIHYVIS